MKREEPSTESPVCEAAGPVVFRTASGVLSRVRVLLIGAFPIAGVRPLLARGGVPLVVLGVGLFGNAAQSGW